MHLRCLLWTPVYKQYWLDCALVFWIQEGQEKHFLLKWKKEAKTRVLITGLTQSSVISAWITLGTLLLLEVLDCFVPVPDIIFRVGFIFVQNGAACYSPCKSKAWFMHHSTGGCSIKFNFVREAWGPTMPGLTLWTGERGAWEFITVSNMRNAAFEWNICLLSKRRHVCSW